MKLVFYPSHFFERATMAATGTDPAFPLNHVSDRDIEALWKDSGFSGTRVLSGQWAGSPDPFPPVGDWLIPPGHGLVGVTLSLESSANGSAWTARDSFTPSTTAAVNRAIPSGPFTFEWWRMTMIGAGSAPYLAELILSKSVTMPFGPSIGGFRDGVRSEVVRRVTTGGTVRKSRYWGPRWRASYTVRDILPADWATLIADVAPIVDAKFCYMTDADGVLRYVEVLEPDWLGEAAPIDRRDVSLELQAVA
jgi:hypothetical protein